MDDIILQFHTSAVAVLWPLLSKVPTWITYAVAYSVGGCVVLGWIALMAIVGTYGERRIAGFIQVRYGPNRVGPQGIFQPLADGIKLLCKEDTVPNVANRALFFVAPVLVLLGAMIPFAVLPFSERIVLTNMELALYYVLAFQAIEVIGILMAGWGPGSKWSLYGGMRLAAQMLSYEIPLGLCALVIILLSGSLNLGEIARWQAGPFLGMEHPWIFGWAVFRSPAALIAFFMFYVGGLAATKRAPFDLPEAESELVAGYHTEYAGIRFAFFFMAEYAAMYVVCAMSAILFLGGWHGPIPRPETAEGFEFMKTWSDLIQAGAPGAATFVDRCTLFVSSLWSVVSSNDGIRLIAREAIGAANVVGKSFFLYFVMIWARWTFPRIRIDQVMHLCLKVLLPIGLGCVIWAAVQVVLFPH
ncbi:NADH-quinone oxidoreductase subunit H [Candidatus Sumerlaeota bacterium]|nr:NADH-quinone oxidoreductase subunit H [Candidatus Sumerlaeota bacterium]